MLQEALGAGAQPAEAGFGLKVAPGLLPDTAGLCPEPAVPQPFPDGGQGADNEEMPDLGESPALLALTDPMARSLAVPGFQAALADPQPLSAGADPWPPGLEGLLERMVRRAQWGGDGRRGTARIELGAGTLAGGVLLVTLEQGELSIDLELPPGVAAKELGERLRDRLGAKGLILSSFTVS